MYNNGKYSSKLHIGKKNHQVIMNLVSRFELKNNYLDEYDLWAGIIAATDFTVWSTYQNSLQTIPGKLMPILDMILNTPFITDWEYIRRGKQELIDKNNPKNSKPHNYRKYWCLIRKRTNTRIRTKVPTQLPRFGKIEL